MNHPSSHPDSGRRWLLLLALGLTLALPALAQNISLPASITAIVPAGHQATLVITATNLAPIDMDLLVNEAIASCDTPADIPWLSSSQISATIPASSSQVFDLLFDATGLTPGMYNGLLCFESSVLTSTVTTTPVPVSMDVPGPIPAVSTLGLVALAGLLAAGAFLWLRRLS